MRLVDLGLDAAVEVVFDLVAVFEMVDLGLTATEFDLGLVVGVDFTLALDRAAVGVDFVLDLEDEARVVFAVLEVADLVLLAAAVFETVVLRLDTLADASGIEF